LRVCAGREQASAHRCQLRFARSRRIARRRGRSTRILRTRIGKSRSGTKNGHEFRARRDNLEKTLIRRLFQRRMIVNGQRA
jgi:hypothetical protein